MPRFRIYYSDGSRYEGLGQADWQAAKDDGVQVVVDLDVPSNCWSYEKDGEKVSVLDRTLYTGEEEYNPFGWGPKYGKLIDTETYFKIWNLACGDD